MGSRRRQQDATAARDSTQGRWLFRVSVGAGLGLGLEDDDEDDDLVTVRFCRMAARISSGRRRRSG